MHWNDGQLVLNIPEGAETLPHLWNLETEGGMWIASFHKLMPENQEDQARIIKEMVSIYNNY